MSVGKASNNSGVALFTVIIFVLILSSLAIAAIFMMSGSAMLSTNQVERVKALYAAEAGTVHGLELMRNGQTPTDIIVGSYTVHVESKSSIQVGHSGQYIVIPLEARVTYPH